ncbi:MAG TPA: YaaL family protein [Bacillales bacterium]|nr:YaaL family protein [Bacillales bacterium]
MKRKRRLRKQVNERLLDAISRAKQDWLRQREMVEKSIDPADSVIHELKLAESRYFFLLKEAKVLFADHPS